MSLIERLAEHVRACFTGLWIESHEHQDALVAIAQLCQQEDWRHATWDIEQGLRVPGADVDTDGSDPLAAIRSVNALATPDGTTILVLQNFHRFLQSAEIVQAIAQQVIAGKQNRTILAILSPIVQLPVELERHFVIIEHEPPDRSQLAEIARGIATEDDELPDEPNLTTILDAAAGLTRLEAENAFSLSLVRHGRVTADAIWELKAQSLKRSGLLQLHRGSESFDQLGGMQALKAFCLRAMRSQGNRDPLRRPRGVLLLSPPGCGKSSIAKALGNETGRPTLTLDVGTLMGSLVGSTESNVRQALRIIDSMAPAVCMVDEVEKAFAGVASSGQTDSGVTARMFGQFLNWMNDRTSDVFICATCNDLSQLPAAFSRAERFDAVWFVDLPGANERLAIWNIYLRMFDLDTEQLKPDDAAWTGAEIKACCRLAALLDVPLVQAAQNVVPVSRTAGESVAKLREWASGRCLDADRGGIYQSRSTKSGTRRRVRRTNPSTN